MQKRHLHIFLLIILVGCGSPKFSENNPYIHNNKPFSREFSPSSDGKIFLFNGARFEITRALGGHRDFKVELTNSAEQFFQFNWKNTELQDLLNGRVFRKAASLEIVSKDSARSIEIFPLGEKNFAFVLRGISENDCGLIATANSKSEMFVSETKKFGKDRISFVLSLESQNIANQLANRKAEQFAELVLKPLADTLAFSLNTGDERTNQAFAMLSASLAGVAKFLNYDTREELENHAQLVPALYLTNRQVPDLVTDNGKVGKSRFSLSQKIAYGWQAFRGAVFYGMVNANTASVALKAAQTLQEREAKKDFSFENELIADSLLRTAIGHADLSGMCSFIEEIFNGRGQTFDATTYRSLVMMHSKLAKRDFSSCLKKYAAGQTKETRSKLEAVLGESSAKKGEADDLTTGNDALLHPPDTLRYVETGARVGFNLIADDPEKWLRQVPLNNFLWQKWVAYRFGKEVKLTQTPDYDSLLTLLTEGKNPGLMMAIAQEGSEAEVDLLGMCAAYQNIAEIYVGYKPDFVKQRIDLTPHLPPSWGPTAAKLPFGEASLYLDYDFVKETAFVKIENPVNEITVVFNYPIPTGGYIPTQFKLSAERPRVKVKLRRIHENQMELEVEDANE